jgi:predicted HTH transcriptional regulator
MSKDKIAKRIGKSRATITRTLAKLVQNEKIQRVGSDKTGHWEVIAPKK